MEPGLAQQRLEGGRQLGLDQAVPWRNQGSTWSSPIPICCMIMIPYPISIPIKVWWLWWLWYYDDPYHVISHRYDPHLYDDYDSHISVFTWLFGAFNGEPVSKQMDAKWYKWSPSSQGSELAFWALHRREVGESEIVDIVACGWWEVAPVEVFWKQGPRNSCRRPCFGPRGAHNMPQQGEGWRSRHPL